MAEGLCDVLAPEFQADGILVAPVAPDRALPGWRTFVGGHPLPNAESFAAGRAILDRLARCNEKTLVFFLISGGGSSLVEQPLGAGVTLNDFRALNAALVTCGAPIEEMNAVRKHLSATKGGRLAAAAARSTKLTFAISDVPLGEESALASGPTLPDPSTVDDAERVVKKYGLLQKLPSAFRAPFELHQLQETPKDGDSGFARAHFQLLLGSHDLTHAAHHACEAAGYVCVCDSSTDNWPIEKAADHLLGLLQTQRAANPGRRVAVIADGEVSSPVTGDGIGGRNSAFALACVDKHRGRENHDLERRHGWNRRKQHGGGCGGGRRDLRTRAGAAGLEPQDFQRRSDAYNFFAQLGDAVVTGPTGNNLRDLRILLAD